MHVRVWFIDFECVSIITVQSIFRAEPKEAAAILKDHPHRTLGEPLFDIYMVKTQDALADLGQRCRGHPAWRGGNRRPWGNNFRSRWRGGPAPARGGNKGKKESKKEAETSLHLSIHLRSIVHNPSLSFSINTPLRRGFYPSLIAWEECLCHP